MKANNILKTRRGQLIAFSVLTIFLASVVIWDLINHTGKKEDVVEPRLHRVESPGASVGWVDAQDVVGSDLSVVSKLYEGYERLRPVLPMIKKDVEPDLNFIAAKNDFEAASTPLIKFEYLREDRVTNNIVEVPALNLPVGTMIYARLLRPINSTQPKEDQPIYAELTRPLVLNASIVLPENTRLIGNLKALRKRHASFSTVWRVVVDGKDRYTLDGRLQERDYDPSRGVYGAFDGVEGLRMKPLDITYEPKTHKLERLFEEVVRPLAIRRTQSEVLSQLELPTIDDPLDIDGYEGDDEDAGEAYYLPSGTEFYLWVG